MNALLGVLALAAMPADGNELPELTTRMELHSQIGSQPRRGELVWSSEALFQYIIIDEGMKPTVDDGFGLRLEGGFEQFIDPSISIGGYLTLAANYFPGNTMSTGAEGGDWVNLPVFVGGKMKWSAPQGFFAEVILGIGFIYYGGLDIRLSSTSPWLPLLDSSANFAFESGTHFGYRFSQSFGILIGVVFQYSLPPDVNQTTLPGGFFTRNLENLTIDIGVWIRF